MNTKVPTVIIFNGEGMGRTERDLRLTLAKKYLQLILEAKMIPNAICFYADGVKLVVEDSPVLDVLSGLEQEGVRLIVCSTCLDFLGLREKVKIGIIGGMTDIIEAQFKAEKVIVL